VEVIWTIIPFLIVIGMALPATKVLVASKDTSNADVTIKATGYQWKWGYDYLSGEGQGVSFLATLDATHREISNDGAKGRDVPNDYLLKVDNPMVVPVNKKVRIITTANDVIHAWGVPGLRRQAGRDPRLRARHLVPQREDRRLLRPVLRAVRQGTRLHADPREGGRAEDTRLGGGEQKKMAAKQDDPAKVWTLPTSCARREGLRRQLRGLPPANGKGAGPIKPLDGSPSCWTPTRPSRSTSC
jgi:cytochrome c oxidase subunit 2